MLMNIIDIFTYKQTKMRVSRDVHQLTYCMVHFSKEFFGRKQLKLQIFCLLISEETHFIKYPFGFFFFLRLLNLNFFIYLKHIEVEYAWRKFHMRFTSLKKGLLRKLNKYPCQILSIKTHLKQTFNKCYFKIIFNYFFCFCPRDSPGKNTGVGYHALLQGNLLNPGIEPESPAWQSD